MSGRLKAVFGHAVLMVFSKGRWRRPVSRGAHPAARWGGRHSGPHGILGWRHITGRRRPVARRWKFIARGWRPIVTPVSGTVLVGAWPGWRRAPVAWHWSGPSRHWLIETVLPGTASAWSRALRGIYLLQCNADDAVKFQLLFFITDSPEFLKMMKSNRVSFEFECAGFFAG